MTIRDDLVSLHAYNRWADQTMLEAVRRLSPEQFVQEPVPGWASVRGTLVHIASATLIWATRLGVQSRPLKAFPPEDEFPAVVDLERFFRDGHDAFDGLLADPSLTPDRLASVWEYRNLRGEPYRVPLWTVFRHVVNHATYHRGQISAKLKRLGIDATSTDFITWAIARTPQKE